MSSRQKGLQRVREVRKILEGLGHQVEGPGYSVAFFGGSMKPIHKDYFGVADLISYSPDDKEFILHQVTDLSNKSAHVKAIQEMGLSCWVWCRLEGKVEYRVFFVTPDNVESGGVVFRHG
jgi:hypothetical protein